MGSDLTAGKANISETVTSLCIVIKRPVRFIFNGIHPQFACHKFTVKVAVSDRPRAQLTI